MTSTNNANASTNTGYTPIHGAVANGHPEIVRLLMTSTDNPNAPNNFGFTPEYFASQARHHEVVKLLKNI